MSVRRILVATDFSPGAQAAIKLAVSLARPLGASLTVLNVFPLPNWVLPDGTVFLADAPTLGELSTRATAALDTIKQALTADGLEVDTQAVPGSPAEEIVRAAREGNYDMVVMGTHGRTGLRHLLIGSVAERVVRLASCPVLTVRG
jgi:nucleotide-binding universal stress UspA family protein